MNQKSPSPYLHLYTFQTIIDALDDESEGSGNYDLDTPGDVKTTTVDLEAFINDVGNGHYFYIGSLTTPTCNEQVLWIIMEKVISMDQYQVTESILY